MNDRPSDTTSSPVSAKETPTADADQLAPAPRPSSRAIRIELGAICACILWSTAFAGVKIGLRYVDPLFFAGIRFALAGLILLPFCGGHRKLWETLRRGTKTVLLVAFFQTVLLYALFFVGMTLIPGAVGAIVIGSSPLFAAVTAHILIPTDRMTGHKFISILIGIVGIVLISISRKPWSGANSWELVGILMLAAGSISGAVGNVLVKTAPVELDPLPLNSLQILLGGLILIALSLLFEGVPSFGMQPTFYAALIYLAILSAVTFSIWFTLLNKPSAKVSELNFWKFIVPVSGAILSWIILTDESPSLVPVIGMIIVATAIVLFHLTGHRTAPQSPTAVTARTVLPSTRPNGDRRSDDT